MQAVVRRMSESSYHTHNGIQQYSKLNEIGCEYIPPHYISLYFIYYQIYIPYCSNINIYLTYFLAIYNPLQLEEFTIYLYFLIN